MIIQDLTDLYLKEFNLLAEALYLCWHNSLCDSTKQIDEGKLKEQIRSYGFYPHKYTIRKNIPIRFRSKLKFKTLTWVNDFTGSIAEDTVCEYTEPYREAIKEIRNNLFLLSNRADKIAYANIILCDLDKSYIHNHELDINSQEFIYKELFGYVLNHSFIAEDNVTVNDANKKVYPIYDLTVRLFNHFDFIEKLVEMFLCFDINLGTLNKKAKYNLFIFDENLCTDTLYRQDNDVFPKFNSPLSDGCLIKIMLFLESEKWLVNPNSDTWLYWFNRKPYGYKAQMVWKGTPTMLSNVIQHICTKSVANTIKIAFGTREYVKPTRSDYKKGNTYKKIEQIITISNK